MDLSVLSAEGMSVLAALLLGGALAGFLSGLLGIGGGAILVPILYEVFLRAGVDERTLMQLTLGTSFAVIVPTAIRSFRAHRCRGAVDEAALRRLAPFVLVGVLLGIALITVVDGDVLKAVWAVCAAALACKMIVGRRPTSASSELPRNGLVEIAALTIGALSTLMSVGGGIFLVSLFTMLGWPMLRAVATSSGFGPIIAVPALLGYVYAGFGNPHLPEHSIGYVNYLAAIVIIPLSVLVAPVGVTVAHRIPQRSLELAFAAFLLISAARFAVSLY